jgi:hypothetical protein
MSEEANLDREYFDQQTFNIEQNLKLEREITERDITAIHDIVKTQKALVYQSI